MPKKCWLHCCMQYNAPGAVVCLENFQRRKMRQKLNLEGSGCKDCLVHFFCCCCALVQEEEELKNPFNREILLGEKDSPYTIPKQPKRRQERMVYTSSSNEQESTDEQNAQAS